MTAEVFGGREPHQGFSTTTLLVAALAGALVAGLMLYPWQRETIRDRDRTVAAMAAAHETMQGQVNALRAQATELQAKVAEFRDESRRLSNRLEERLGDYRARLGEERQAHRRAEAQSRALLGAPLEDGRHMVYVEDVQLGSPPFLTFDLLTVYKGSEAEEQANRQDATTDAEGLLVVNRSKALRTMEVTADAPVQVNYWHRDTIKTGTPVSLETFSNILAGTAGWQVANQNSRYWLTVEGGRITSIHPYFTVIAC